MPLRLNRSSAQTQDHVEFTPGGLGKEPRVFLAVSMPLLPLSCSTYSPATSAYTSSLAPRAQLQQLVLGILALVVGRHPGVDRDARG